MTHPSWTKWLPFWQMTFPNEFFLNENGRISIEIPLKFVPKNPIDNKPALVQIMAWCWPGNKPLFWPMMARLPMHICTTLPEWVNLLWPGDVIWHHRSQSTLVGIMIQFISPNAAYIRQRIKSALVQMMACRQFGTKPLSKQMLSCC